MFELQLRINHCCITRTDDTLNVLEFNEYDSIQSELELSKLSQMYTQNAKENIIYFILICNIMFSKFIIYSQICRTTYHIININSQINLVVHII